jgi:hypothetical protein
MSENSGLIAEIKVLLQQELKDIREGMHSIHIDVTNLKASTASKLDLEQAIKVEREKRELAAERLNAFDKQIHGMQEGSRVYIGIASALAGIAGSVLTAIVIKALT